jgi:tetratricopeptide (TPR) repeat protein
MNIRLSGKQPSFRQQQPGASAYRALVLLIIVLASFFLLKAINQNAIKPAFMPTQVPTRQSSSFALEGESHFTSGNLDAAIEAYNRALKLDQNNAQLLSELARIETYSSALLTTDQEQRDRLQSALSHAKQAVQVAPDDSSAHAIYAFVLDWNANPSLIGTEAGKSQAQAQADADKLLAQAQSEANHATQIDNQNTLALVYSAEILLDQHNLTQAQQYIQLALQRDQSLMDVHRVNAYVLETLGNYSEAIKAYEKAIAITPNLTFLYIRVGAIYRVLKQYNEALKYYSEAVAINEQNNVTDPVPYLAIGKTYTQMGEFFAAALNVRKALQYNPYSQDVYGQLGIVYFHSRNYEGAIPALKCAVKGCTAQESCDVRQCDEEQQKTPIPMEGLGLTANTVVYYYTYGSVLSGMHVPSDDYCVQAMEIFREIRAQFIDDVNVMSIVKEGEQICSPSSPAETPTELLSTGTPRGTAKAPQRTPTSP